MSTRAAYHPLLDVVREAMKPRLIREIPPGDVPSDSRWAAVGASGVPLFAAALSAPLVGISKRWPKVLHAVEMGEIVRAWPSGTVTAACGVKGLRLLVWGADRVPGLWPPRVKGLPDGHERCRACHEATGEQSPRSEFRRVA